MHDAWFLLVDVFDEGLAAEEGGFGLEVERCVEGDAHAGFDLRSCGRGDGGGRLAVQEAELVVGAVGAPRVQAERVMGFVDGEGRERDWGAGGGHVGGSESDVVGLVSEWELTGTRVLEHVDRLSRVIHLNRLTGTLRAACALILYLPVVVDEGDGEERLCEGTIEG